MWVTCIFIKHEYPHIHSTFSSLINSILEHRIVADQGFNWLCIENMFFFSEKLASDEDHRCTRWYQFLKLLSFVSCNPDPLISGESKSPSTGGSKEEEGTSGICTCYTAVSTPLHVCAYFYDYFFPCDHYDFGIVYACYNMFMLQNAMTIFCTCHTATIIQPLENKHNSLKGNSIQDILCTIIHYCAAQAQVPLICQINPPIHLPVHLFSPIRHRASFQIKIHNMRHHAASCSSWLGSKFQTKNLNFWGYFMSIVTQKVQLWFQKCQVVVIIRSGEKKLSTNSRLHRSEIWWHFVRPFACNPITSARKGRGGA